MFRSKLLVVATLAVALVGASARAGTTITISRTDNGTTLPFQRHIVRLGSPSSSPGLLAAAIQRNNSDGQGLVLLVSSDGGASWSKSQNIQPDTTQRDTADLVADPDGMGFSLVYGIEPVSSQFVASSKADVVYLHYTLGSNNELTVDRGPVVVFRPGTGQGWYRPALIRDSQGTLHATASLLDGSSYTFWERMSIDGGLEWTSAERLASFGSSFGGGRLVAYGSKVMALYDAYRATDPGRYRTKDAGPCSSWGSEISFASNGLYHAGAFSVVATPDGHVHLGHSDKNSQQLWYREYDGSSWSSALRIESAGDWSQQPSLSQRGNTVFYAWNRFNNTNLNTILIRVRTNGSWGSTSTLDTENSWKGYTSSLESILPGEPALILWSQGPADASSPMKIQLQLFDP
jgi:hypothetical protein